MPMTEPALAVLCLINNNREHTRQFVEYFTSVPGCRLILFLDNPEHEAYLGEHPDNLTIVPCNDAYWMEQLGRAPVDMPEKQHTNIERGASIARQLNCRWCVSVDSDEQILNLPELVAKLDELGVQHDLLRVLPAELVHTESTAFTTEPFKGYLFKYRWTERRINKLLLRLSLMLMFGLVMRLMFMRKFTRRFFFGHFNGKTIFSLDATITTYKQHKQFNDEQELTELVLPNRYLVLHHDAMNYEEWLFKWTRRISGSTRATAISNQRKLQTRMIGDCLGAEDQGESSRALFRRWYVFNQREIEAMKKAGYLLDLTDTA
jgi:hypothetical protein